MLEIEGYAIFCEDRWTRSTSEGCGTIICAKGWLKAQPLENMLGPDIERKLIKTVRPRCKPVIIGTLYRPQISSLIDLLEL